MVEIFDGDDPGYLAWMVNNPDGFVINTRRGDTGRSGMLHRSGCAHIRVLRKVEGVKGFTQGGGIKFCSNEVRLVLHAVADHKSLPLFRVVSCRSCEPVLTDVLLERMPEEVDPSSSDIDTRSIRVDALEQDPYSRALAIEEHGPGCSVCGSDLERIYGILGRNALVSHRVSNGFADQSRSRVVPVCPNCHSMLHRGRSTPLAIEDLRKIMFRTKVRYHGSGPIGAGLLKDG